MTEKFPLRKRRNDVEHAEAVNILSRLLGRSNPLSAGERDYAEALGLFVQEYDGQVYPFPKEKHGPLKVLRYVAIYRGGIAPTERALACSGFDFYRLRFSSRPKSPAPTVAAARPFDVRGGSDC